MSSNLRRLRQKYIGRALLHCEEPSRSLIGNQKLIFYQESHSSCVYSKYHQWLYWLLQNLARSLSPDWISSSFLKRDCSCTSFSGNQVDPYSLGRSNRASIFDWNHPDKWSSRWGIDRQWLIWVQGLQLVIPLRLNQRHRCCWNRNLDSSYLYLLSSRPYPLFS